MIIIVTSVKWYLIVVLICISLVMLDILLCGIGHLYIFFGEICIYWLDLLSWVFFGHTACRILVPLPTIESEPPAVEAESPNRCTVRKFSCSFFKNIFYWFIFGHAGSSLLHAVFRSCDKWGLLSSCSAQASHLWLILLQSMGSRARGPQ